MRSRANASSRCPPAGSVLAFASDGGNGRRKLAPSKITGKAILSGVNNAVAVA
jgi:hypothetical protein